MNDALFFVYTVDNEKNQVEEVPDIPNSLNEYVTILVKRNSERKNHREYKFNDSEVIPTMLRPIIEEKDKNVIDEVFFHLAQKLLETQDNVIKSHPNTQKPQKGSLIFAYYAEHLLVSKVDFEAFLNTEDYTRITGLPFEKSNEKTVYMEIEDSMFVNIVASDSNPTIANYWTNDFLEMTPINRDEENTRKMFNQIDNFLKKNVKPVSNRDYTDLRNGLVTYFRNNDSFEANSAVDSIVAEDYEPYDEKLDVLTLRGKLQDKIQHAKKVDTQFKINQKMIKARIRNKYQLLDNVELVTNGEIDNVRDTIFAREVNGEKSLIVRGIDDKAYNNFYKGD